MVFQDPFGSLNPRMTVSDILAEGPVIMGEGRSEKQIEELLDIVGLPKEAGTRYPHEFSGGQRQRIGIARALAVNPSFSCATSPYPPSTSPYRPRSSTSSKTSRPASPSRTSSWPTTSRWCATSPTRFSVMYIGHVMEEAPTEELFANPCHPYTQALFASIPSLDPTKRKGLKPISGDAAVARGPAAGVQIRVEVPEGDGAVQGGGDQTTSKSPRSTTRGACCTTEGVTGGRRHSEKCPPAAL